MSDRGLFSISEFAEFARTTRAALIHYDKIGLLSPAVRAENGYRYYSNDQLDQVKLIRTCQTLGVSLTDAVEYAETRTPEKAVAMFGRQIKRIDDAIAEWERARKLVLTLKQMTEETCGVDESAVTFKELPATPVIMGEKNVYGGRRDDNAALCDFYRYFRKKRPDIDVSYPVWGVFDIERVKRRDFRWPDRYYFNNPEGEDEIPAGLYAVAYGRGGYGSPAKSENDVYARLLRFVEREGFEICGPAYEEYPQNEISTRNSEYLIRVKIPVSPR